MTINLIKYHTQLVSVNEYIRAQNWRLFYYSGNRTQSIYLDISDILSMETTVCLGERKSFVVICCEYYKVDQLINYIPSYLEDFLSEKSILTQAIQITDLGSS